MPILKDLADLSDTPTMQTAVKGVKKMPGHFAFVNKCKKLDNRTVLAIDAPKLSSGIVTGLKGERLIRGTCEYENGIYIFRPRGEVNKTQMERGLKKLSKEMGLKLKDFVIKTPADLAEQEAQKEAGQQEVIDKLDGQSVERESLVQRSKKGVGNLTSLGSKGREKKKAATQARERMAKLLAGQDQQPLLPEPPMPAGLDVVADNADVEAARLHAHEAFVAAEGAVTSLQRNQQTLRRLEVILNDCVRNHPDDTELMQQIFAAFSHCREQVELAEQKLKRSADAQKLLELTRRQALEEDWSDEEQETMTALRASLDQSEAALSALQVRIQENTRKREEADEVLETLEDAREAAWTAVNNIETVIEAREEQYRPLREKYHRKKTALASETNEKKRAALLKEMAALKMELGPLKEGLQMLRVEQARVQQRADQAEDALDPHSAAKQELDDEAIAQEAGRLELRAHRDEQALKESRARLEIHEEHLKAAWAELAAAAGDTNPVTSQHARTLADQALEAALAISQPLQERRRELLAAILARTQLQEKAATAEDFKALAEELQGLRAELLTVEQSWSEAQQGVRTAERGVQEVASQQRAERTVLMQTAEADPDLAAAVQKVREQESAVRDGRQEVDEAEGTASLSASMADDGELLLQIEGHIQEVRALVKDLPVLKKLNGLDYTPDALKALKKLGPEVEQEVNQLLVTFQNHAEAMRALGATPDHLQRLWDMLPDVLTPDAFVKELRRWREMQKQLETELGRAREKPSSSVFTEFLKEAVDKAETLDKVAAEVADKATASLSIVNDTVGAMVDSGVIQAGAVPVEILGSAAQVVSLVGTVLSLGTDVLDLGESSNKFAKSRKSMDPVERLLAEEMLADAITALTRDAVKAGLDVVSLIVPLLGAAVKTADAIELLYTAGKRASAAHDDRDLKKSAKVLESDLTSAVDQSAKYEQQQANAAFSKACGKMLSAAGSATLDIGLLTSGGDWGATAATGTAIMITGDSIYLGTELVMQVSSWSNALACWKMVKAAQKGDRKAQKEIFAYSGKYAKGILAIRARQNDPVAVSYIKSRGLTPDMIQKSSPEIIRKYLLYRSGEDDFTLEPSGLEQLLEIHKQASQKMAAAKQRLSDYRNRDKLKDIQAFTMVELPVMPPEIAGIVGQLRHAQDSLQAMDAQSDAYTDLKSMLATWESQVQDLREPLLVASADLNERLQLIDTEMFRFRQAVEKAGDSATEKKAAEKSVAQVTAFRNALLKQIVTLQVASSKLAEVV